VKTSRRGLAWGVAVMTAGAAAAFSQPLVPLDDRPAEPILPAAISRDAVELSGQYAYLWAADENTQVIQYQGSFELLTGARRMTAQAAVVWMTRAVWQNRGYYHYQVFLWRDARLIEAAGTVTSGPALFVTFNSYEAAEVRADATVAQSSADTDLYREAVRIRETIEKAGPVTTQPGQLRVVPFGPGAAAPVQPRVRPLVQYRGDRQTINEKEGLATAIGHVYVSQGLLESESFLEIRADAAVLFLAPRESETAPPLAAATRPGPEGAPAAEAAQRPDREGLAQALGRSVSGAYLEGNVVLTRGEQMIRAPQIYYDFENDRALILDAVFRGVIPERDLPLYVRARKIRQLSSTEYMAEKAMLSTSEFHTPHVYLGADKVVLVDRTPRTLDGRVTGPIAGQYRAYHTTLNLEGVPVLYWPYAQGDFRQTENLLRSARFAYSDDFGATAQTKWYLFNLLGLETPEGWDSALRLDYFSERGPGVGIDLDYRTENAFGLFRGYYINDQGEDELGPFRSGEPDTENRGRLLWRHRQYLPRDWQLTLEFSYLSDPTFLEEYFKSEWFEEKEQETLVYLKKQRDNWAFTLLANWRINDFLTQTEHLPDAAFHLVGEPLGEFASFYSESHLGTARYRPDDRRLINQDRADNTSRSDITFRGVTREEIDFPLKLGPVNVVPFAVGRYGYWDGSPHSGSLSQGFGMVGARGGTRFWRLYEDVRSRLFDVNGVRHIIEPEFTGWLSAANENSFDLHPFDPAIEGVDDFSGASFAIRQRWQTRRGGPGRWRTVDWITLDVEAGAFADAPRDELPTGYVFSARPENSIARNHVRANASYRVSDTTAILADANWDLNDDNMDRFGLSYAVERTPRFSYFLGYRRIHETDSNLLGFGANYQINSKHTLALREYFDLERGSTETFDLTIIRRFPRWYAALTLGLDEIEDTMHISLAVWPEGVPEAALGSRRYTGLATSTGINAQQRDSYESARSAPGGAEQ